jgi:hypothetical protein
MRWLVPLIVLAAACGDNGLLPPDAAPPDGPPLDPACPDPRYGDGTCQADLSCGVPDIDCFVIFPTDLDAASWATQRIGTSTLGQTDPLFVRARALTDRAWAMFTMDVPVGRLATHRVGLSVMDDPRINAFALADGDPGKVGMSVQIDRGLLENGLTDDQIVGVLLHELTHVVKLHALIDVQFLTRKYYVAYDGEPIGAFEHEPKVARAAGIAWRAYAVMGGIANDPVYSDLPIDGNLANLFDQYATSVQTRIPACIDAVNVVEHLRGTLNRMPLDGSIPFSPAQQAAATGSLDMLHTCVAGDPFTLRDLASALGSAWTVYLATELSGPEKTLLDGRALESILALVQKRRSQLHRIEEAFTARTTAPWTALRYYSYEEEADDYSVRIGTAHGVDEVGVSATMFAVLGDARPACEAVLAAPPVPYGINLLDDHHAPCWRIAHARQLAAMLTAHAAPALAPSPPRETWTPTRRETPTPVY